MLLVDHFATSWGTTHHPSGKGVWFRLTRSRDLVTPNGSLPAVGAPSPAALTVLAHTELPLGDPTGLVPLAGQLLDRLCGAAGAVGAAVRLDQADGQGLRPIAEYGDQVADPRRLIPVPLPGSRPRGGGLRPGTHPPLPAPVDGFAVPLVARGQQLGLLLVGRHPEHRQHDPEELTIVDDLARRFALAIDNARIHAERRRVARTLQQSLL